MWNNGVLKNFVVYYIYHCILSAYTISSSSHNRRTMYNSTAVWPHNMSNFKTTSHGCAHRMSTRPSVNHSARPGMATNLIVVCCHGIWNGGPTAGADEAEWLIADFQRGETGIFSEHVRAGVRCLAASRGRSVLAFSGYVFLTHNVPCHFHTCRKTKEMRARC